MRLFLQNLEWRLIEFSGNYERANVFWFIEVLKSWERML